MPRRELGGLACHVVDDLPPGRNPSLAVILCHGFGAPESDLVPIGEELLAAAPELAGRVRFYFAVAPMDLGPRGLPGGRAWWWIDLDRLVQAAQQGRLRDLRAETPDGLADATDGLFGLIDAVRAETGLPLSRVVLGGFSQGAMLATAAALALPEPVAGLAAFSGTLLSEAAWTAAAAKQKPLRVLLSHGRHDPVLPFAGSEALRDALAAAGHAVEFVPFNGGHTIPRPALEAFLRMLRETADRG